MENSLIEDFGEPITVIRSSPASAPTADGTVMPGSTTTFQTIASIQPLTGFELVDIPEGERAKMWMKFYCEDQLNTGSTYPSIPADIVIRGDGNQFKVTKVQPWVDTDLAIAPYWAGRMCLLNP